VPKKTLQAVTRRRWMNTLRLLIREETTTRRSQRERGRPVIRKLILDFGQRLEPGQWVGNGGEEKEKTRDEKTQVRYSSIEEEKK